MPAANAALAAFLMCSGVSKSGSPAAILTTSTPARFSSKARAVTATVLEGLRVCVALDKAFMAADYKSLALGFFGGGSRLSVT